jgi:peptide/nickel transport system permease protein
LFTCGRSVGRKFKANRFANQLAIVKNIEDVSGPASFVLKFALRKSIQGVLMIFAVSAIAFGLLSSAGGDALTSLRDNPQVSPETVERLKAVHGLDRPLPLRYFNWLGRALTGDLGESFAYRTPVGVLVLSRLANTIATGAVALLIALIVSMFLAYLATRHRNRLMDAAAELAVLVTASTPRIVLSLIALFLIVSLGDAKESPVSGSSLILPISAVVLSFPLIAIFLTQMTSELGNAMRLSFVQLARAKGLSERKVIMKHAFREAMNPLISLLGISLGGIAGGSVVVETVLGWPGIGALTVAAVRSRDVSLVMGIVVIASGAVWLGNAIAEMLQMFNDRRILDAEIRPD